MRTLFQTEICSAASDRNNEVLHQKLSIFSRGSDSNNKAELQYLEFVSPLSSEDYRLLEVNALIADRLMAGEELVIRGEQEDSAVLCTSDETFDIKEVVTSNVLLLIPEFHFSTKTNVDNNSEITREVIAMKNNFLEIRKMAYVSVQRLKEKLSESELEWIERCNINEKLYTVADLLNTVQMSELQLTNCLKSMPVICLDGYVRLLSTEYRDRLVTELVDYLDDDEEPGITLGAIELECLKNAFKKHHPEKDIPMEVVLWLINTFCNDVEVCGERIRCINEKAICRAKISQLLRAAVQIEYDVFEKSLQQILPIGVYSKVEYFEGLAYIDDQLATGKTIRYLNVEDLPEEPIKRFQILFTLRQSWKMSDMRPYFVDLCPTDRLLNEIFMSFCKQKIGREKEKILIGLKEELL
ncbi:unnamed protein product [Thelazia callipaeda]|uniref:Sister chromatid cohesion protein DCC1 n=1 Tax=Thelazia callipaeda TaxID=103827 RepID=A0A0N5CRL9_THECL|nr:unnamed protein product [Thelazia callipaeda]